MNQKSKKILVFDLDGTIYDPYDPNNKEENGIWNIRVFDGLLPLLESDQHKKILVTKELEGMPPKFQDKKIDTLGIRRYFAEIYMVSTDEEKYERFKEILKNLDKEKEEAVIIGDRIDSEIRYGNMLGLKTILVRHGKYKDLVPKDEYEVPNHTIEIDSFSALPSLLDA